MGGGSSKNKDTQQHDDEGQEDEDVEREELNNEPRRSVVEKKVCLTVIDWFNWFIYQFQYNLHSLQTSKVYTIHFK